MKTRKLRVILVTASAALLTAMGMVGAGFASTASAATQADQLVQAQHHEGDKHRDGDKERDGDKDKSECMLESWLCDADEIPVWAPWTDLGPTAPVEAPLTDLGPATPVDNGGGTGGGDTGGGGTPSDTIPFDGIGGGIGGGGTIGGGTIGGGSAIGGTIGGTIGGSSAIDGGLAADGFNALTPADNGRDVNANIPFAVPAQVGVGRTMLLPDRDVTSQTPAICAVRGDELLFKNKGTCAITNPTVDGGRTFHTTTVVWKGGATAGTKLPAIQARATFAPNNATLSAKDRNAINAQLPTLKTNELTTVTAYVAQGNGKSAATNAKVAEARAAAAVKYLKGKGINVDRVVVDSKDKAPHKDAVAGGEVVVRGQAH